MFTLSRNNWFIKYWVYLHATIGIGREIDNTTNLCALFWHTVLVAPLFFSLLVIIGPPVGVIVGIVFVIGYVGNFLREHVGSKLPSCPDKLVSFFDIIFEYFKAKKQKMCPLITILDD